MYICYSTFCPVVKMAAVFSGNLLQVGCTTITCEKLCMVYPLCLVYLQHGPSIHTSHPTPSCFRTDHVLCSITQKTTVGIYCVTEKLSTCVHNIGSADARREDAA